MTRSTGQRKGFPRGGSLFERWADRVEPSDGCWEWTGGINYAGYGVAILDRKPYLAHRLSYQLNIGPIPPEMVICHRCDNRRCCAPHHLFVGTHADNVKDCIAKGRDWRGVPPVGARNGRAKLTPEQVAIIRASAKLLRELSTEFGVSMTQISEIKRGKSWSCDL